MANQGTAGPNRATYLAYDANEVHFYNNGALNNVGTAPGGYFFDLHKAMGEARHFIFIADWSFHPMVVLKRQLPPGQKEFKNADTIGFQLGTIAKRDGMLVAIHTWNHDLVLPNSLNPAFDTPNDKGGEWLDRINGGKRPDRLLWRASARTGAGFSQHQKFVVMDCPVDPANPEDPKRQLKAFMGGLDITKGRIDWRDHANLTGDGEAAPFLFKTRIDFTESGLLGPKPKSAEFNEWYNAEFFNLEPDNADALSPTVPRQTWHDIACQIKGPTAWDLLREFVGRWNKTAGGFLVGDHDDKAIKTVLDKYAALLGSGDIVRPEAPVANSAANWKGRILRSMPKEHWGDPDKVAVPAAAKGKFDWTLESATFERSIQDFYVDTIRSAERFVYIETQYLIGSGAKWRNSRGSVANAIPEAIVERTKTMIAQGKPFHTYVVMPMFPEGPPVSFVSSPQWQRRFEFETMRFMAVAIHTEARKQQMDWFNFVSFLFPVRWEALAAEPSTKGGRDQRVKDNKRYMVYVHSKAMIVDDRAVIIGSANLNERSLAGNRDAEICVYLEPGKDKDAAAKAEVAKFRKDVWLGLLAPRPIQSNPPAAWDAPESPACVRAVHGAAFRNYLYFRRGLDKVIAGGQTFVPGGLLAAFPLDMVTNGLPDPKGDFGVIETDKLTTPNAGNGVPGLATLTELPEILKRKCSDGDAFLPDPDGSDDKWRWSSDTGKPGVAGAAE